MINYLNYLNLNQISFYCMRILIQTWVKVNSRAEWIYKQVHRAYNYYTIVQLSMKVYLKYLISSLLRFRKAILCPWKSSCFKFCLKLFPILHLYKMDRRLQFLRELNTSKQNTIVEITTKWPVIQFYQSSL